MIKQIVVPGLVALCFSLPAVAADTPFEALRGLEAEELSTTEMSAIQGQLTLAEVTTAINSSTKLTLNQKAALVKYVTFWWNWLSTNTRWFSSLMAKI